MAALPPLFPLSLCDDCHFERSEKSKNFKQILKRVRCCNFLVENKFAQFRIMQYFCIRFLRDVAQHGLEYSSGGRVVAGSNPVIPTIIA